MDAETLEALKGSIAKWEGVVAGKRDHGETDCPLCALYNDCRNVNAEPDCEGCPVAEKAGVSYCRNTPYVNFNKLMWKYPNVDRSVLREAAQAELDFLKSLLPSPDKSMEQV